MNILKITFGKNRWLVSLIVIGAIVAVSVLIICSNQVFPTGSSDGVGVVAVGDNSGGAILALHKNNTIYAQHIDSAGQDQWGEEGLIIAECPSGSSLSIVEDSLGGAIVSWYDTSNRPDDHHDPTYFEPIPFYCRRITSDGQVIWGNEPVSSGRERFVISDGTGGAIIAWDNYSVYFKGLWDNYLRLQRITPDGNYLWGDNGLLVVASSPFRLLTDEDRAAGIKGNKTRSLPTYMGNHRIAGDDAGGVFVFWDEEIVMWEYGLYAQRLDAEGNYVWPERITVAKEQLRSAESNGSGGAIVRTPEGTNYSGIGKVGSPLAIHIDNDGTILEMQGYNPADITMSDGVGGSFSIRVEEDPSYGRSPGKSPYPLD